MKTVIAKRIATSNGKGFAFQAYGVGAVQREKIEQLMASDEIKKAEPFIRGDHPSLVIVEFWSEDLNQVKSAIQGLADGLGVKLNTSNKLSREYARAA